jgi:hypothetical protein
MLARIRSAWRAWRERNRQYAIDRAVYKMGGGTKRSAGGSDAGPGTERGLEAGIDGGLDGGD